MVEHIPAQGVPVFDENDDWDPVLEKLHNVLSRIEEEGPEKEADDLIFQTRQIEERVVALHARLEKRKESLKQALTKSVLEAQKAAQQDEDEAEDEDDEEESDEDWPDEVAEGVRESQTEVMQAWDDALSTDAADLKRSEPAHAWAALKAPGAKQELDLSQMSPDMQRAMEARQAIMRTQQIQQVMEVKKREEEQKVMEAQHALEAQKVQEEKAQRALEVQRALEQQATAASQVLLLQQQAAQQKEVQAQMLAAYKRQLEDVPDDDNRPKHYKKTPCKFWEQGMCSRGRECTFSHGEDESGLHALGVPPLLPPDTGPPLMGSQPPMMGGPTIMGAPPMMGGTPLMGNPPMMGAPTMIDPAMAAAAVGTPVPPAPVLVPPPGSLPSGSLPTGSLPTGSLPTGSLPTGSLPTGSLPTVPLPPVSTGPLPPGTLPPVSIPPGSPGTLPTGPPPPPPPGAGMTTPAKEETYFKLGLCKWWPTGECKRGADCTFAHGEHEIGTPIKAWSGQEKGGTPSPVPLEAPTGVKTLPPNPALRPPLPVTPAGPLPLPVPANTVPGMLAASLAGAPLPIDAVDSAWGGDSAVTLALNAATPLNSAAAVPLNPAAAVPLNSTAVVPLAPPPVPLPQEMVATTAASVAAMTATCSVEYSAWFGEGSVVARNDAAKLLEAFKASSSEDVTASWSAENPATPWYKTQICKFYQQGKCTRGTRCSYAHGDEDMRQYGGVAEAGGKPR